jgi:hypothetical protein
MSEAMTGQVREGYRCIQCLEPFEVAWPESCTACGYAVSARQPERFGQEFVGTVRLGPSTSIDDELAIAEEMIQRRALEETGFRRTRAGVVIPRGL